MYKPGSLHNKEASITEITVDCYKFYKKNTTNKKRPVPQMAKYFSHTGSQEADLDTSQAEAVSGRKQVFN